MRVKKKRCERKITTIDHQAVRILRVELGLTLAKAGEKLGLSAKGLGAIENGRVMLSEERVREIVNLYGLEWRDFLRAKRLIKRGEYKKKGRESVKKVLKNEDRRSYQKIITKESRVLKSLRRMKGLSQYQASELCGYPRATIGHIENGRIELSQERIEYIVRSYGFRGGEFEESLGKNELRDQVLDFCNLKLEGFNNEKLNLIRGIIMNIQ